MQKIRYITLPSLKPTFTILLLMSLGGIIRGQFDLFYQLIGNNGLLFGTTDIIDTYVYRVLRVSPNIGMGSAVGLYQSVIGALMVLGSNYLIKSWNRRTHYSNQEVIDVGSATKYTRVMQPLT